MFTDLATGQTGSDNETNSGDGASSALERQISKLRPAQYIHLSHDYICSSSPSQALLIIEFAEQLGYSGDSLIMLQKALILKALNRIDDANLMMDKACVAIPIADRTYLSGSDTTFEGSSLPVFCAYLVCIRHLQRRRSSSISATISSKSEEISEAMLVEVMYIKFGEEYELEQALEWVSRSDVWLDAADKLYNSDFILLAEECYWESFKLFWLTDYPITQCVSIMVKTKRTDNILPFVLKCIEINPYSAFCREYLKIVENKSPEITKLLYRIDAEEQFIVQIQSVGRMYHHYKHFHKKKKLLRALKRKYAQNVQTAIAKGKLALQKDKHRRFYAWRHTARQIKIQKLAGAVFLRQYMRASMCRLRYLRKLRRRSTLPYKYLDACQVSFDYTRRHYLQIWKKVMIVLDMTRSVDAIRYSLWMTNRSQKLQSIKSIITKIRTKNRQCVVLKMMQKWKFRYVYRTEKRALARIREFIRKTFRRYKDKLYEASMSRKFTAVKTLILGNRKMLITRRWLKWRKIFLQKRRLWAVHTLSKRLPIIFARRRDRPVVKKLRRLREHAARAKGVKSYQDMKSVFRFWTILFSIYKIQRSVRQMIARRKTAKRRLLISQVERRYDMTFSTCKKTFYGRWKVYTIMHKELKQRSASIITLWWQRIHRSLKAIIVRNQRRGSRIFSRCFYSMVCKRAFVKINKAVLMLKQFEALNNCYSILRIFYLKVAFIRILEFKHRHDQMRQVLHITTHKKLGRIFFIGVHISSYIAPKFILSSAVNDELSRLRPNLLSKSLLSYSYGKFDSKRGGVSPHILTVKECGGCTCGLRDTYMEWEFYVKPHVFALKNFGHYALLKAFQILMATYRIRIRRQRSLSFIMAETLSESVLRRVSVRWAAACTIQRSARLYLARQIIRRKLSKQRIITEVFYKMTSLAPVVRSWFGKMYDIVSRRTYARIKLQTWIRMKLKRKYLSIIKAKFLIREKKEVYIKNKIKFATLSAIVRHMMLGYAVRSSQMSLKPQDHLTSFGGSLLEHPVNSMPFPPQLEPNTRRQHGQAMMSSSASEIFVSTVNVDAKETSLVGVSRSLGGRKTFKNKSGLVVPGVIQSFQSPAFHEHLFHLKKSGAFVLDSSKPIITNDEIVYLSSQADTVFCEVNSSSGNMGLKYILQSFNGSKLVVFGGCVELAAARDLCFYISNDNILTSNDKQLKLHLTGAILPIEIIERFSRILALSTCNLFELSVDTNSVGILGIMSILAALRINRTLRVLLLNFNGRINSQWCIGNCFRYISENKTLQGLYIYGMRFDKETSLCLLAATRDGLPSLAALEFEYHDADLEISKEFRNVISSREVPMRISINDP